MLVKQVQTWHWPWRFLGHELQISRRSLKTSFGAMTGAPEKRYLTVRMIDFVRFEKLSLRMIIGTSSSSGQALSAVGLRRW